MDEATIKALVIDDYRDDVDLLQATFAEAGAEDFRITHVEQLAEGLALLDTEHFDVIILELDLQDSSGITSLNQTVARAPDLPIVVLTRIDDEIMALNALQAGAQDYLVKGQAVGEMLVRSIRYAVQRHQAQSQQLRAARETRKGRVLSFIGAKGGVGTTTIVSNVAAALAVNHSVSVVELRSDYGTLALQLNCTSEQTISNLLRTAPERLDKREVEKCLFPLDFGPRVVFGPQAVGDFLDIEVEHASAIIGLLQQMFQYTVIDLPCNPSPATQLACRVSDYVGLVLQPEPYGIRTARLRLELLRSWDLKNEKIGAVAVSLSASATAVALTAIEAQLQCRIIGVMAPAAEACAAAMELGVPLVLHQPEQIAAVTLGEMSQRLAAEEIEPIRL